MWLWSSSDLSDDPFINTFCSPNLSAEDFRNQLGQFTPCFTDIVILGACHTTAIICYVIHWHQALSCGHVKHRLTGSSGFWHLTSLVAALACMLVPIFQLNARLGAAAGDTDLRPAPYEWAGAALACLSWLVLVLLLSYERTGHFVRPGRWLVRFAVVLVTSGELVKLRFLLQAADAQGRYDYFFWLYVGYVGLQLYLSMLSVFWLPCKDHLQVAQEPIDGYLPLASAPEEGALLASDPSHRPYFPEVHAGIWGRLTFSYMSKMMAVGYRGALGSSLHWRLPPKDSVTHLNTTFQRHWSAEMALPPTKASLTRAFWRTARPLLLTALPFKLLNDASQFVGPIFLNKLLEVVAMQQPAREGYLYAVCIFAGSVVGLMADNQHFQRAMRAGFRLRSLVSAQVHAKVFKLSPAARGKFTSGRIFNLVSSDAETVQMFCQNIFGVVSSPLRIIVAMSLLYQHLGPASIVAVVAIIAIIPLNATLVQWSSAMLKRALGFTDERTKLEGELVAGIEVVKCSTWEEPFQQRIASARDQELKMLWRVNVLNAVTQFILFAVPTIIPVVTFSAYLLLGNMLTAAEAFTALALFNVLRFPMFMLPQMVSQFTQARVSLARVQEFLAAEDLLEAVPLPPAPAGSPAITMAGDYTWDSEVPPALVDVKLVVPSGSLVVVVGSTGSGKTTLLSAMLGLVQQVYGPPPVVRGRVAYVPQAAFIIGATVRENILFGAGFDEQRYRRAVSAACLEHDFQQLPAGDATELGDRGTNISGGQKQRISIARAVYSEADVLMMDDVLSALDAKVGRKVFEKAIRGVLVDKTVVLTTNQLQFANHADLVLFITNGRIAESGTFNELIAAGKGFAAMMKEAQVDHSEPEDSETALALAESTGEAVPAEAAPPDAAAPGVGKLTSDEGMSSGAVSRAVLWAYIQALGGAAWFAYLQLGFVLVEGLRVMTTVWLSFWTGVVMFQTWGGALLACHHEHASRTTGLDSVDNHDAPHGAKFYLGIYAAISGGQLLGQLGNALEVARLGQGAARRLHDNLLVSLVNAPMAFFHTTPGGRIINRLTKDTGDIDRQLASNTAFAFRSFLQLGSTLVLVGIVAPFALSPLVAILFIFYWLYAYFQASVRQVKRLDAVTRSPVFTSVSEAISGVATIRAFSAEQRLMTRHCDLIDANTLMTLLNQSMNRWLSVRLESLGAFATLLTSLVAVEQRGSAASMGLLLSYTMQITVITSMTLRLASMAEMSFNAVERVVEYSHIDPEGAPLSGARGGAAGSTAQLPPDWPATGVVEFKDVHMRYRPGLPLVLRGVSFRADALDKVGVVGRTGAGKSSMIGCLFRLVEIESGAIEIDGVNIAKLALKQLRSKTAIIPQVPVLFTGSIRINLSPFGQHSDAELWNALRRAHLDGVVEAWPAGLDAVLQEGGAPLSAGQKQLLALARALLNPSRVLVLDEATANVDVETDALIQKTMHEEFGDRTILAIAHRLHTIIDYNKVLVLDKGRVAEYGPPAELLNLPGSAFSSMVDDTGEATARFLRNVAQGRQDLQTMYRDQAREAKQRLGTPRPSGAGDGGAGVPLGQLASSLMDRSAATVKALRAVTRALGRAAEHEDLALLEWSQEARRASRADLSADVASAQAALLQAAALMAQVQELAETALHQAQGFDAYAVDTLALSPAPRRNRAHQRASHDGSFSLMPLSATNSGAFGEDGTCAPVLLTARSTSMLSRASSMGRSHFSALPVVAENVGSEGSGINAGAGGLEERAESLRQLAGLLGRQSMRDIRHQNGEVWGQNGQH